MTTINVGANTTSTTTHAAGTTWGNRRVRLLAVKPSLAQAPPKKSAAMASREAIVHPIVNSGATDGQVLPLASVTSTSTASENGEATSMPPAVIVPVKQPPVSAPAVLQRQRAASEAAITVAAAVAATANLNTQMQLRRAPLAVRPLAAMGSNGYHGTMSSGSTTSASEHCTGTTTPNTVGSPSSERNSPDCTAPASTPFNLNDGRPSLWARRSSLVTKKSGEIVKPSLKIKTRGMKPRSKSEPTTPTKFVHFDAQICRVRFFRHVESPRSVAGTESEGENTESEDSDSEDEAFRSSSSSSSLSFINGHSRIEDTLEQGDRAVEEAQGLRSGEYRLQLVNLPETSVFHLTMRPISIEWIRLAGNARHLRVLTCCQNIAFHKAVTIRYTFDNWQTQEDISGEFYDSISNGGFDRFLACIPIYDMLAANSQSNATQTMEPLVVELCVRYLVDGKEFWDNNRGSNYRVIVTRSPITTNNSYQQRMIMNPNDGYFSLPALTAHHQDRRRHQHHQDRTSSERKRIQQDAEKAWQQVLMKSRTEDDDDDERDVLPIQQRRFKPSTAASRQSTAMTTSNTATGTTTATVTATNNNNTATTETIGQSPDHWMVAAPRKPSKKNTSFAGRYDFGASLKAATRSNQRRPLRRMTSSEDDDNNNNNSSNQDVVEEMIESTAAAATQPSSFKTQIGFNLPNTTATTTTTNATATITANTVPKSTSALSRAISVSKPLTSSNSSPVVNSSPIVTATANSNHSVNSSLTGPALPWSRSHSPSAAITTTTSITSSTTTTTTGSNSNFMMATTTNPASLVSPVFSNKSVMNQFATSPSVLSLDDGARPYTNTTTTNTTNSNSTSTSIPVAIATTAPYSSTPYHSMMMASYATSPNFGGGSFGFYGQPQQSHLSGSYNSNTAHYGHSINDYYCKDEFAYHQQHHHHPYDTSAALASPKTSASFFRTSHGFYPASNQNSPMTNGNTTTNNVHRRNSNHSTLPFSDSPLPSPSTTPLPWIRG